MKIAPGRVDAFLRRPPQTVRAILLYGPDSGLIRERADIVSRTVVDDMSDPFRVAALTAATLGGDPARLSDEMSALSLTGGRRLIRVRDAGDAIAALITAVLSSPPAGDSLLVVEAGDLDKRSRLRTAFETSDIAAAVACYVEDEASLGRVIGQTLAAAGLSISPDAESYLAANLVGDRMVARTEIEKLITYMGEETRVELEHAQACVGDSAALALDEPAWAAADGDFTALDRALGRLFGEGTSPIAILRTTQRHFQRLHLVTARISRGDTAQKAMQALKPPVFFKMEARFMGQIRRWGPDTVYQALDRLTETEAACKRTGMPDQVLCARLLFQIASLARNETAPRPPSRSR